MMNSSTSGDVAPASGLPTWDQLSRRDRTIVGLSAGTDYVLRTAAATLVGATLTPAMLGPRVARRERDRLGFYADLAAAHDPVKSFPRPTAVPQIRRRRANRVAQAMAKGPVDALSFDSPFEAINPEFRDVWKTFGRNNVAHAQHWRHDDGPRPTLCVIHGFAGSSHWLNALFFELPWFYQAGFDVLLYTLPFHGVRAARFSPFSGHGYFSRGFTGFSESMAHAVHDFRIFIDYLESTGVEKIAVTGVSLGGYTSALLAGVEERLRVAIPNVPVTDLGDLVGSWFPLSTMLSAGLRSRSIGRDLVDQSLSYSSPLNYPPLVPKEGRMIITGLGDRLAPPEQSEKLWRHWDRPALQWFPGNHTMHIGRRDYLPAMMNLLRENYFTPKESRPDLPRRAS